MKRLRISLTATLFGLGLVACGGSATPKPAPPATAPVVQESPDESAGEPTETESAGETDDSTDSPDSGDDESEESDDSGEDDSGDGDGDDDDDGSDDEP